jgi:anti-anti-sigma regulatory factor
MEQKFRIEIQNGGSSDTIHFHGNIDSHADYLFAALPGRISKDSLVFDFSKTGRINSMGIALLLRSLKSLKSGKSVDIRIQGASQVNAMLFKMTGIYLMAPEARRE